MRVKHLLIPVFALFVLGTLAGSSYAKIDPQCVMGMWLFEVEGDVGKDSSENANDGNVEGDPEWTSDGKFGGGLHFDAVDDVIKVPMTVDYDEITVMVWAMEEGSPVRPRIVSNDHTDVSMKGFQLMYNTAGSGSWFDVGDGARRVGASFAYTAEIGEWYHFTGTYDGSTVRAYIDGEVMAEAGGLSDPIADSGIDVHIGTSTYAFSDALKGVLDEVAIFNKALTENEIQEIMADGLEKATGILAVAPAEKLASAWGSIKGE
jgi:hypothetical protein